MFGSLICMLKFWQRPGIQKVQELPLPYSRDIDTGCEFMDQHSFYLHHATESAYYDYYCLFDNHS